MSSNPLLQSNLGPPPPPPSGTLQPPPGQHKKRNSLDSQLAAHKLHAPQGFPPGGFHHQVIQGAPQQQP
jgi:hypothetical protein